MEPPAVTSCGHSSSGTVGNQQHQHGQTQKRDNVSIGFLQIEPQISFNTPNRHFEELPENFLETISPQQHSVHGHSSMITTTSPQLASLTTVSMAGGAANGESGYANLVPMPNSSHSHYISALKMESMDHLSHHPQLRQSGQIEKTNFGGPAGLLSPLQMEGNRGETNSLGLLGGVHHHRPNGGSRTSDLLSGIRRNNVSYIKEEVNPTEIGYQTAHDYDGNYTTMQQPTPQELERMANAETPPALSNVEITSSILASLSHDHDSPSPSIQQSSPHTHFIVHQMPRQHQMHSIQQSGSRSSGSRSKSKQNQKQQQQQEVQRIVAQEAVNIDSYSMGTGNVQAVHVPYTLQPGDIDPLNAEIDDEIYIDTKDLCKRVAYELKQHSIPQAIFAERILCRSQGTLSDLLRNPKPWNRLKSGRETFKRMYNWLQQPLHIRLSILDMYKGPMASNVIPPPTPAQNSRHHHRRRNSTGEDGQPQKRPRLVFTDIQKRTLQAIFKETQRPSREMQQTIAEHLRLDMSTVSNFFMNARRRSRNGNGLGDEPAPYQQIRTITPPPDSPPTAQQHQMLNEHQQPPTRAARTKPSFSHQQSSSINLSHIEQTVDEVVGRSIAYARSKSTSLYAPPVSQEIIEQPPIWEEEVQVDLMPFTIGTANRDVRESENAEINNEEANGAEFVERDDSMDEVKGVKSEDNETIEEESIVNQEEKQGSQKLKNESPRNDADAPTAPGTPITHNVNEIDDLMETAEHQQCDEPERQNEDEDQE